MISISPEIINKWSTIINNIEPLWQYLPPLQKGITIAKLDSYYKEHINIIVTKDEEAIIKLIILWRFSGTRIKQSVLHYLKNKEKEYVNLTWTKYSSVLKVPPNIPIKYE